MSLARTPADSNTDGSGRRQTASTISLRMFKAGAMKAPPAPSPRLVWLSLPPGPTPVDAQMNVGARIFGAERQATTLLELPVAILRRMSLGSRCTRPFLMAAGLQRGRHPT